MVDQPVILSKRREQALWMAYVGWLLTLAVMVVLRVLGYSDITLGQLAIFLTLATIAHVSSLTVARYGWDRYCRFDPHFVLTPNWLLFAPIAAYGYYALGSARDIMLVGWLMGLFFLAGYIRFLGIVLTSVWYMLCYLLILSWNQYHGRIHVDFVRELIRCLVLLTVCGFFAFLLDRFASQRNHLTRSIQALREKDQQITRLNQKLAKFITAPLVEKLATDELDTILHHQRRKITIFFSDITAFSTITDALEPEEMASLLNQYFSEMIQIVVQFGGTLDKLMGDGMMVLFGAPSAAEPADGAWSCIQMATTMQQRLEEMNDRLWDQGIPYRLRVRMGINTGLSIVGSFGSDMWMNYTAIGGQVNIAARLQQMAEPGQILLSHSTYALLNHRLEAEKLGEIKLKGPHYPIHVYQFIKLNRAEVAVVVKESGPGFRLSINPDLLRQEDRERLDRLFRDLLSNMKEKKTGSS